jgi:Glycosyl transferase family 2
MSDGRAVTRIPWPLSDGRASPPGRPRVGIVVANSNTRRLIAQLVFSLYRLLGRKEFAQLVIVDNASTDGSRQLLNALHAEALIHLIRNRSERYHGPALTQGVSWLASRQRSVGPRDAIDCVWVLDSDAIVLRRETVRDALKMLKDRGASLIGQRTGDPADDRLLHGNAEMLHPCCLIFDPVAVWRAPIPPFLEDGAPATELQVGADRMGHRLETFPFIEEGYVLHLGRGTLREVAASNAMENRYHAWAVTHRSHHFGGRADGERLYRVFSELFDTEVGELCPENLVDACRDGRLLELLS